MFCRKTIFIDFSLDKTRNITDYKHESNNDFSVFRKENISYIPVRKIDKSNFNEIVLRKNGIQLFLEFLKEYIKKSILT